MRAEKKMSRNTCTICGEAPAASPTGESCIACYDLGGHENSHNDNGHDELNELLGKLPSLGAVELREAAKGKVKNTGKDRMRSEALRLALSDYVGVEIDGCWVCRPELVPAAPKHIRRSAPTTERPSRKGQKINVPLRAPGELKAAVVIAAAGEERSFLNSLGGGVCSLDVNLPDFSIHLSWDGEGRFDYEESHVRVGSGKTKKVRNVAEALRWIKAA